jgi:hypothetical protein
VKVKPGRSRDDMSFRSFLSAIPPSSYFLRHSLPTLASGVWMRMQWLHRQRWWEADKKPQKGRVATIALHRSHCSIGLEANTPEGERCRNRPMSRDILHLQGSWHGSGAERRQDSGWKCLSPVRIRSILDPGGKRGWQRINLREGISNTSHKSVSRIRYIFAAMKNISLPKRLPGPLCLLVVPMKPCECCEV